MSSLAIQLHELFNQKTRLSSPFDKTDIPTNGIYIIFEKGEKLGELDRIVRVGTHTGKNQLLSRLQQHFVKENKNRSIFRKNIGRCILAKENPNYLPIWELDTTPKKDREIKLKMIDTDYEKSLEQQISEYIQNNLSFVVFEVNTKDERLFWESKITSTLAQSNEIKPSENWLGNHSPKDKIRQSGLWQVNELNKSILTNDEFDELVKLVG